jgi:excisionase family DNA binding protein
MDPPLRFECEIPPELVETIALRAAELVESRVEEVGPWLAAPEAAEYLRCPPSRIYRLSSLGRIPVHRDGSRLLFNRNELDAWVAQGGGKLPG